ncbi:hypothetical protein S7711_01506 [Stachybotrys chartarum IBT 7711]|uniref:Mannan endo-1,6-alpha-mannosidase n=1 Tax=Stachybotrys chartarum (strain CBS 109288 / IBT 7711) TaxID=1280523 RepID=A0A084B766_STACB|nr:hypothetical protein S7711_01506 [Stachybotrys chartarum IBT 7711]KFA52682.1 hypothetical protein S40293_05457 [Stachybotrys chartarum IBT 40293]KFA73578.1 hypothetical protein S40288_09097 [Stachybotrys chartarum IBT 40288]
MKAPWQLSVVALGLLTNQVNGIPLDISDDDSVREAAATIAYGLMRYYTGNNTGDNPGNLPDPYYWWEAGAMFGTIVDYWALTGDDSYNNITLQALVHQAGEDRDYNPANQTLSMGNDDQGFWAMAAMSAAENRFPDPPEDQPQYVPLVQSVFNEYSMRWEEDVCGGGLRWQVYSTNVGYDYKNTISNGCLFNIASRLGRYTNNDTYLEWADRVWDWQVERNLITDRLELRDGTHIDNVTNECDSIDQTQWTYNAGIFLHGAAVMYNVTQDEKWRTRVNGIIENSKSVFFPDGIMHEQNCEPYSRCNIDQRSFKGYFTRWLAHTSHLVPSTSDEIRPLLEADAQAAAAVCTGTSPGEFPGHPGTGCGFQWTTDGVHDNWYGVGEQMNALSAVMYMLIPGFEGPATLETGGTSESDPSGGVSDDSKLPSYAPITTGDRVGAGFLTVLLCAGIVGYTSFLVLG